MTATPGALAAPLSDLDVVALTLDREAGGEPLAGLEAVASVLANRCAWGLWGPSLRDVCLSAVRRRDGVIVAQFSCWAPLEGDRNYRRLQALIAAVAIGRRPATMARAYGVAERLEAGAVVDRTGGADHYYAPAAMRPPGRVPFWAAGRPPVAEIGGHRFYRLREA